MIGVFQGGNCLAVCNALNHLGKTYSIIQSLNDLKEFDRYILPGVGHFDACMANLNSAALVSPIKAEIKSGKLILGICVGMQMLFSGSEEGHRAGLGLLEGKFVRFDPNSNSMKNKPIPHIGWNWVKPDKKSKLFDGEVSKFYYVHSYFMDPDCQYRIASSKYGEDFCCAVQHENIFGVQFHPEKSNKAGLNLIKKFCDI